MSSPFSAKRSGPSTSPRKRKRRKKSLRTPLLPLREEKIRNEHVHIPLLLLKDQQS